MINAKGQIPANGLSTVGFDVLFHREKAGKEDDAIAGRVNEYAQPAQRALGILEEALIEAGERLAQSEKAISGAGQRVVLPVIDARSQRIPLHRSDELKNVHVAGDLKSMGRMSLIMTRDLGGHGPCNSATRYRDCFMSPAAGTRTAAPSQAFALAAREERLPSPNVCFGSRIHMIGAGD